MENEQGLIPPRKPPRKQFGWAIPIVIAVVGVSIVFGLNQREETGLRALLEEGVEIEVMDRRFAFVDRGWEYFQGKYVLSGGLVMLGGSNYKTFEVNAQLYRAVCGEILTKISSMADAPAGRSDLFRLALSFPVFSSGEPTGETYGQPINNLPIDDGACPSIEEIETTSFNTFAGVLRRWGLKGLYEYSSNLSNAPSMAAVFAPRNERIVPPLPFQEACHAAVFDFEDSFPAEVALPDKLAILILGKPANEVDSPTGEAGLAQHFLIEDGTCSVASEVIPLQRDD